MTGTTVLVARAESLRPSASPTPADLYGPVPAPNGGTVATAEAAVSAADAVGRATVRGAAPLCGAHALRLPTSAPTSAPGIATPASTTQAGVGRRSARAKVRGYSVSAVSTPAPLACVHCSPAGRVRGVHASGAHVRRAAHPGVRVSAAVRRTPTRAPAPRVPCARGCALIRARSNACARTRPSGCAVMQQCVRACAIHVRAAVLFDGRVRPGLPMQSEVRRGVRDRSA